jgi:rare lipoprotein A
MILAWGESHAKNSRTAQGGRQIGMRGGFMRSGQAGQTAVDASSAAVCRLPSAVKLAAVIATAVTVANCGQPRVASNGRSIDPRYGVAASPRVIEDGQPVPKGGGRELVGRPYQIAGRTYVPRENVNGYSRTGLASWYGSAFHGRLTANGEIFDRHSIAAAHTTMPLPSYARVTNVQNGRSMIVRVNDRGPYHANRLIDVSETVAEALEFKRMGTARVRVDYVGRASTRGSDDRKLMATLRIDGAPAPFPGASRTMFAGLQESAPAASSAPAQSVAWFGGARAEEPQARFGSGAAAPALASQAPVQVAAAEPASAGRPAPGIPLPPERPFDLGTIPDAATPVRAAALVPTPPSRPVLAGLYYADPQAPKTRFARSDPFKDLKSQAFVPLKAIP